MTIKIFVPTSPNRIFSPKAIKLFLAGGIDRAPNWQDDILTRLKYKYVNAKPNQDLVIFNPRRSEPFTREDYEAHSQQVKWEFDNLREANIISFWFPKEAPCTTSLFELGYWLNSDKVILGIEPGHYKEQSLRTQTKLLNKGIEICTTLDKLADSILRKVIITEICR